MTSALPISRPDTPPPGPDSSTDLSASFSSTSSIQSPASSSDSHGSSRFLLPVPTASGNSSQASFAYSDVDVDGSPLDPLPPEIASAELSIAPDGSFVETPSGPAARELKRRYDHHYGVGVNVRSPYAITAFINQHGRQMYRVGKREKKTPPGASAVEADEQQRQRASTSASASTNASVSSSSDSRAHSPRRSRLSVTMFNKAGGSGAGGRPHTPAANGSGTVTRNKLRKTRSFSEMASSGAAAAAASSSPSSMAMRNPARGHSQSVTSADFTSSTSPYAYGVAGGAGESSSMSISGTRPGLGGDEFAEVMGWYPGTSTNLSLSISTSSRNHSQPPTELTHPFGPAILFDSPASKPKFELLPTPQRLLREMQSFESGLTARPGEEMLSNGVHRYEEEEESSLDGHSMKRPPSALRLRDSTTSAAPSFLSSVFDSLDELPLDSDPPPDSHPSPSPTPPPAVNPTLAPLPETALHSRYSPDVFDVLQTFSGLPLLEKLVADEGTVIKMSLEKEGRGNVAAPKDDPRFVVWGEVIPEGAEKQEGEGDEVSLESSHGQAEAGSASSGMSLNKKRSVRGGNSKDKGKAAAASSEPPLPVLKLSLPSSSASASSPPPSSPDTPPPRILVAATIERWIAQLTSDLSYDELLNFFLTYRTYISAVDLCHLLICRFHWALLQPKSPQDEVVRRVVRVRTFVAIRYWLLTFFVVDFMPDRELRMLVAGWLNTLVRDPVLKRHVDGLSIVRKLKKVAKDCKRVHTRAPPKPKPPRPSSVKVGDQQSADGQSQPHSSPQTQHVLGEHFAAATRKAQPDDEDDSDVDLDFRASEGTVPDSDVDRLANAHLLSTVHLGSGTGTRAMPISALPGGGDGAAGAAAAGAETTRGVAGGVGGPFVQSPATLPIHHMSISRAFVNTIGRLGRWKRVLNQRGSAAVAVGAAMGGSGGIIGGGRVPMGAAGTGANAVHLELNVRRDLLSVNGGVEQYLKMIEPAATAAPPPAPPPASAPVSAPVPDAKENLSPVLASISLPAKASLDCSGDTPAEPPEDVIVAPDPDPVPGPESVPTASAEPEPEAPEVASLRAESFDRPSSEVASLRPESIDRPSSFRSSSTDSFGAPIAPGLATFPGGAQTQWQFEVMSIDELDLSDNSSDEHADGPSVPPGLRQPVRRLPLRREFEFVRRSDTVSSLGQRSAHSSVASSASAAPDEPMQLAQWQMNALVDSLTDEGERGDVEAALNRLEGQINPEKQQEKADKVNMWMRTMRERFLNGDYEDEERQFSDEEEDAEDEEEPRSNDDSDAAREPHDITIVEPDAADGDGGIEAVVTPINAHSAHPPRHADDGKPAPEDAVPLEILQSRMPPNTTAPVSRPQVTKFVNPETTRFHHSFILGHPAQLLAEHFAMIDRELFMGVKFEEVLADWQADEGIEVLDWGQFLKDRARWKLDPQWSDKISALGAVRARFNLMTKFVVTEVVLSIPSERPAVVSKFIRIAWHSYLLCNFNTLVAIITGLRSPLVSRALKTWKSVGRWEMRVYSDLKVYVTSADDFKHIRQTIADTKSQDAAVVSAGDNDPRASKHKSMNDHKPASACVPFIGVYLSQLYRHNQLPDLIDPTAPTVPVGIDPVTSNFDAPSHPEVFSALAPLPPSMHLEPLINVHKQRLIARVIKSMVAGQHLASRVHCTVERRLFQKCLRIRGLDAESLQRALSVYP